MDGISRWLALAGLLLQLLAPASTGAAQEAVTFGPTRLHNRFPDALEFEAQVASAGADIVSAKLFHALRGDSSITRELLEVNPGQQVTLRFTWDTSRITVPPSAPIFFHWEVTDATGNRVRSEEELTYFDDARYDWQVLQDESVAVWWHDRSTGFGKGVFEIAQRSVGGQSELYGAGPAFQIRVIIYNDAEEFAGWHAFVRDFVGGEAFTPLGITTQIVPAAGSQKVWLNDVIPHEIAHLYFYQVTFHPLSDPPLWLNEGLAQFAEFGDHQAELADVQRVILQGDLIPLYVIAGSFGSNERQVRLAYAESLSAVEYLVQSRGAAGVASLLAAFAKGYGYARAFREALERTPDEFEADWLSWLGVPEGMYPTPTPWPTMSMPSSPTPPSGRPSAQPAIPSPARPTVTPPAGTAPLVTPTAPDTGRSPVSPFRCCTCLSAVAPLLLVVVAARIRVAPRQPG